MYIYKCMYTYKVDIVYLRSQTVFEVSSVLVSGFSFIIDFLAWPDIRVLVGEYKGRDGEKQRSVESLV